MLIPAIILVCKRGAVKMVFQMESGKQLQLHLPHTQVKEHGLLVLSLYKHDSPVPELKLTASVLSLNSSDTLCLDVNYFVY